MIKRILFELKLNNNITNNLSFLNLSLQNSFGIEKYFLQYFTLTGWSYIIQIKRLNIFFSCENYRYSRSNYYETKVNI